jgi:hypothetical protein
MHKSWIYDAGMVLLLLAVPLAWGIGLTAVFFGPFYLLAWLMGVPLY